jgi:CrcB protein
MFIYLCIGLGGFLGANARYLIGTWVQARLAHDLTFPYGTLVVNVSGSFLICFLVVCFSQRVDLGSPLRLALLTGFLGSYTTFSAFSNEWLQLFQNGDIGRGLGYILGNVIGGGVAGGLGLLAGRLWS